MLGCLSDIPPGAGTNRNERLHQYIGNYFNRSKIGVLLAYALLSVILYTHNTSARIHGKLVTRPILASQFRDTSAHGVKPMGIIPKDEPNKFNLDHWETDRSERNIDYGLVIPIISKIITKILCLQWTNGVTRHAISYKTCN